VSAICASPADSGTGVVDKVPLDKVRALQHTLYRTAKADPGRRFHALWDKVLRRDVLWRAWVAVRTNNGDRLLDEIQGGPVKRHQRGRGFGWSVLAYKSIDQCGLLSLDGAVIAPRADKPWREKPNAGGERRR